MFWINTWRLLPVTGVGIWLLYTKCIICMLQWWVHCAGISCTIACHGIVNMEYYFIVFIVRYPVFQVGLFLLNLFLLVSVEFNFSSNLRLVHDTWNLCLNYFRSNLRLVHDTWNLCLNYFSSNLRLVHDTWNLCLNYFSSNLRLVHDTWNLCLNYFSSNLRLVHDTWNLCLNSNLQLGSWTGTHISGFCWLASIYIINY